MTPTLSGVIKKTHALCPVSLLSFNFFFSLLVACLLVISAQKVKLSLLVKVVEIDEGPDFVVGF